MILQSQLFSIIISMSKSNVLCICPTFGRLSKLSITIAGFLRQEYKNKQLVIINDDYNVEIKMDGTYNNISIINLARRFNISQKRNIGMGILEGLISIGTIWNDDDIYLPNHIDKHVNYHKEHAADYINTQEYIEYNTEGFKIVDKLHTHSGSYKMKAMSSIGGYNTTDSDDRDIINRFRSTEIISDISNITYVRNYIHRYEQSCSTYKQIAENAKNERTQLLDENVSEYIITPDFKSYDSQLIDVMVFLRSKQL